MEVRNRFKGLDLIEFLKNYGLQVCDIVQEAGIKTIPKKKKCISLIMSDEWISKLWYIYTMEYYSAIKKNTFESVLMRRPGYICDHLGLP